LKVIFVTSEWPSKAHPNHVPFLKENISSLKSKGIITSTYKIKSGSIRNRLISIIQLRKQVKDEKYDIIHVHWGYNGLFCLGLNIPNVVTFHGGDLNKPLLWEIRSIIIYLVSKIATITSQHNIFVSKDLAKKGLSNKNKNSVIPMGIDLDKFVPMDKKECREELKLPLNKHLILFGGNASQAIKRLPLARNALEILDDNHELITIDYIDHNLMPIFMNASDMLLMTSLNEGSPMMIKEALACNLPVASTNVGDVKEQLYGLENCFIIKDETPEAIASVIKRCIKCQGIPNSRVKMLNYSIDVLSDMVIDIYNSKI